MYEKFVVRPWKEKGEFKEAPHKRQIVPLFGPERRNVPEMNVNIAYIDPYSSTSYHNHVIGELIYVVTGRGTGLIGEESFSIEPDTIFWAPKDVFHQVVNTGGETMKLLTVFAPGMNREDQKSRIVSKNPPADLKTLDV